MAFLTMPSSRSRGDDKKYVNEWHSQKREQRKGQLGFDDAMLSAPWERLGNLPEALQALDTMGDETLDDRRQKEQRWQELVSGATYENASPLADTGCRLAALISARLSVLYSESLGTGDDHPLNFSRPLRPCILPLLFTNKDSSFA